MTALDGMALRISVWWRRVWVLTGKELIQLSRDFVLVLFLVYAFTLDIYLAGSGISLALSNARLVVYDADHSAASRELIHRFRPPYFSLQGELQNTRAGTALLDRGQAMVVLDIPPHFQEDLLHGKPTSVQMQIDATNSVLGFLAASYGAQIINRFGLERNRASVGLNGQNSETLPLIRNAHRVWYNPNQIDAWFMSISELLTMITVFAILLPAVAMAREKERGTVEQLLVSPLSPFQILLPKVLAMTLVVLVGTAVSLFGIMQPCFALPIKGSPSLFFALTALYVFTTAGVGLLIAAFTRNMIQVGMLSVLIIAPMVLLSGAWTPPEAMPTWLRYLMATSPLYYFIDASYGVLLRGAGFDIVWDSMLGMTLLGGLALGLGMWRFQRQFG